MTGTDLASFRNDGETGLNEIDGERSCSSVSKDTETVGICKDAVVSVHYKVSFELKNSLDEEHSRSCNIACVNNSEHPQVPVIDKECDHNDVKDIGIDGVSSQNKINLISQDNFGLEKYKFFDSTQANASDALPEVSSKSVTCQADVNEVFDFDSLLELAETGNNQTQGVSDHIGDKRYLDDRLASANNPFLEDSPVETFRGNEKGAVTAAHPSSPYDFEGTLYEPEGNSIGPVETSGNFSANIDFIEGITSSKNPFLDTTSFKLAMDVIKEAEKISGNVVTVEGADKKDLTTHDDEKKTTSDGKAEVPSMSSTVNIGVAGDKMKAPEQSNGPVNGSQLQHDPLESSFATMNPYPALISYSGQIPFSGSISLRSESSATSNRSFAFPVANRVESQPCKNGKSQQKAKQLEAHPAMLVGETSSPHNVTDDKDNSIGVSFLLLVRCNCLQTQLASSRFDQARTENGEVRVSVAKILPRKLQVLTGKVTITAPEHLVNDMPSKSISSEKKIFPDKLQLKKASAAATKPRPGQGQTWQQWMDEGGDSSELFTMDYSRVRRRRPIHNKSLPVGP